jgi:hypothetical protein
LPGLLLGGSIASAQRLVGVEAPPVARAECGANDHTESGLQGQTTPDERASGDSEQAYNCNLELIGSIADDPLFEGIVSQRGPAYYEECAYLHTANAQRNIDNQVNDGIMVVDASDPENPRIVRFVDDTPTALRPHETLKVHAGRGLLAGAEHDGPGFAVYDISEDCTNPTLLASIELHGSSGHMGNFSQDGRTYYVGQSFRGVGGWLHVVDLDDPSHPVELRPWQFDQYEPDGRTHGVWTSVDGTRLYAGQPGQFGAAEDDSSYGPDGLVILDVSDYQYRRRNPEVHVLGRVFWDDQGQVEEMYPVTINGRPHVISSDESGGNAGMGAQAACEREASPHGYPNIIDVSDPTNPVIVASPKLEVNYAGNCNLIVDDPAMAGGGIPGYNQERCIADNPDNPKMIACTFGHAGLRVFDIRDFDNMRELAYYKPAAVRRKFLPSSGVWREDIDLDMTRMAGYPRFYYRESTGEHEIWVATDSQGLEILRFSDEFTGQPRTFRRLGG